MVRAILLSFFLLGAAAAGDWALPMQRKAEEAARNEDYVESAKIYGKAIKRAHKNRDCISEQQLFSAMLASFQPLWKWKAGPDGAGRGVLRDVLLALMQALDEERSAGFMSAHCLANQLIMRATWAGDTRHVKAATEVIEDHADEDDTGVCARAMRNYARGMRQVAKDDLKDAEDELQDAVDVMAREGWVVLAMYAGTELAAVQLKLGHKKGAAATMRKVAGTYPPDGDYATPHIWSELVKARLAKAPAAVLAPYQKVMDAHAKRDAVAPLNAPGKPGLPGGKNRTSLLGRSLAKFSKRKPLMTARRDANGFTLRQRFDKRFEFAQPYQYGVRNKGNQGLTLAYWGYAVALAKFDQTAKLDDPPQAPWPSPFQAFYHLARGETWGLYKRGYVKITKEDR